MKYLGMILILIGWQSQYFVSANGISDCIIASIGGACIVVGLDVFMTEKIKGK